MYCPDCTPRMLPYPGAGVGAVAGEGAEVGAEVSVDAGAGAGTGEVASAGVLHVRVVCVPVCEW